jgi:transcriptional regulator with XRE-family HTH domain
MSNASKPNNFAKALRLVRKSKGLSQEDFSEMSSRTYVSDLERSVKFPTLSKIDDLAAVLGVHPLTLLTLSYLRTADAEAVNRVLELVADEISALE